MIGMAAYIVTTVSQRLGRTMNRRKNLRFSTSSATSLSIGEWITIQKPLRDACATTTKHDDHDSDSSSGNNITYDNVIDNVAKLIMRRPPANSLSMGTYGWVTGEFDCSSSQLYYD